MNFTDWNFLKDEKFPPEAKNENGIGTRKSIPVKVLFNSLDQAYFRIAVYDFQNSHWIIEIGANGDPYAQILPNVVKALAWSRIIQDRPNDNDKIEWLDYDGRRCKGYYVESEDMFTVGFANEVQEWSYGNTILVWKPI